MLKNKIVRVSKIAIKTKKEKEVLLGERENVVLLKKYYDVVECLREAYINKMPFVPFRDWLACFEVPIFIEEFDESHLQLIEMLISSLENLADSYGYTVEVENGCLLSFEEIENSVT